MNRTHLWLALALIAQLVLLAVLRSPSAAEADGVARPFIPQLEGLEPNRIELLGEDDARLELTRSGDSWTIDGGGFPANDEKIDSLLADLRTLKVRRPLVRRARHHGTFRVAQDDFVGRLRIWSDTDDSPAVDLILGTASNYRATHARLRSDDAVYELEGLAPFDLRPLRESWIRKELVDFVADDIVGLRLVNGAGEISLVRDESGWALDGEQALDDGNELDLAAVGDLVDGATSLRLIDSAGAIDAAAQGLETPTARVDFSLRDGRTTRLRIGGPVADDDGKRFAAVDGLDFAVTIWESSLRTLLDATRETIVRPIDRDPVPSDVDGAGEDG